MKIDKSKIIEPKCRVVNVAHGYVCEKCGSSAGRHGFLNFFGQIRCDNERCEYSKKMFKKL